MTTKFCRGKITVMLPRILYVRIIEPSPAIKREAAKMAREALKDPATKAMIGRCARRLAASLRRSRTAQGR
jgi:hypothetical protein